MNNPFVASLLEPGLSLQEIDDKVKNLEFCLPQEVYELYQWHNGINWNKVRLWFPYIPSGCKFIDHFDFLPLEQTLDEYRYLQEVKQEWMEWIENPESYKETPNSRNEVKLFKQNWFPVFASDDLEYLFVLGSPNRNDNSPLFHCHLGGGSIPNRKSYRSLTHFCQVTAECFEMGAYYTTISRFGDIRLECDRDKIVQVEQKYSVNNLE